MIAGADDVTLSICDGSVGGGSTVDSSSGGVAAGAKQPVHFVLDRVPNGCHDTNLEEQK